MKKLLLFSLVLLNLVGCTNVEPNYEGILITNCGRNGIDDFKVVTGRINTSGICTDLVQVPMFEQTGDVPSMNVTSKDGGVFTIDPAYTYRPIRGKGKNIVFNYRQYNSTDSFLDAIEENILSKRVVNAYREEARNYTTDSLMRNMNGYERQVQTRLKSEFEVTYFELLELSSGLTPPPSMQQAIEARNKISIESEQQRLSLEKEKAQLDIALQKARIEVEIAKLEAQSNLEKAKGLTDAVLTEMWINAWSKAGCPMPQVIGENSTIMQFPKK